MKTQIIITFDRTQFETGSDFLSEMLMQFTAFMKNRYLELYYQMPLPYEGMAITWNCPVEAPAKKQPQKVVMPVENEDGETLLSTFNV